MKENKKREKIWYLVFFALIVYLLANTPLVSDDIAHTVNAGLSRDKGIGYFIVPREGWLTTPLENYTHGVWYPLFSLDNLFLVNVIKIAYAALSFYLITRFFSIYLGGINIFLASFLFIFFPSHDSTVFWFLGQHLMLSTAFYLYAYYLAHENKLFLAGLFALAASFVSYGSPPIAIALFIIFILDKKLKKGLVVFIPNVIYLVYYVFMTRIMQAGVNRIPAALNISAIARQFFLQALTFMDSVLGPSMWLKVYYSFSQLSVISLAVGIIAGIFLLRSGVRFSNPENKRHTYNSKLITGLAVLMVSSFLMFAVTGLYPQMAFNLGNRATIFGSLFMTYLIVLLPVPKLMRSIIFIVIFFSVLGISDHWKEWGIHQDRVLRNIRDNQGIKDYKGDRTIYICGNQFSKFGPMSHIEFLSETGVFYNFFKYTFGREISVRAFNRRFKYSEGYLIDKKYGEKKKVNRFINVYDSAKNSLFRVYEEEVESFIENLSPDNRHWIQLIGNKWIKERILKLMPRLEYAL